MFKIRKPSKYGICFQKRLKSRYHLHRSHGQNGVCQDSHFVFASHRVFLSKDDCLCYLPITQKNVYLNIVPSPQALLLFTDLKKWHHYFSSEFFKATIVQLNYWIHLYLIVLLVLMCCWTAFLSEAVSFPRNTENLRLYQGNILHGQDKVSLVLFIACWNLIRGRYAGFKNALPGMLYFFVLEKLLLLCFFVTSIVATGHFGFLKYEIN